MQRTTQDLYEFLLIASDQLGRVEQRGLGVDLTKAADLRTQFRAEEERLLEVLSPWTEKPGAWQRTMKALSEHFGVDVPNTREGTLLELIDNNIAVEFLSPLLEWKKVSKFDGTFLQNVLDREFQGRIHARFKITGTETGRLSSAEPNLQNQPKDMRVLYVPRPGYVFVEGDLSQAEFRVMAVLSGDPASLEMFRKGEDIHSTTAYEVWGDEWLEKFNMPEGTPEHTDAKERRKRAKAINFGLPYGRGAAAVANDFKTRMPLKDAETLHAAFFTRFAGIGAWQNEVKQAARTGRTLQTVFGRKLRLPKPPRDAKRGEIGFLERQALAFLPQSTASDITLTALVNLSLQGWPVVCTVHDSILLEVPEDRAEAAGIALHTALREAGQLFTDQIPFETDTEISFTNWKELHSFKVPGF